MKSEFRCSKPSRLFPGIGIALCVFAGVFVYRNHYTPESVEPSTVGPDSTPQVAGKTSPKSARKERQASAKVPTSTPAPAGTAIPSQPDPENSTPEMRDFLAARHTPS